MARPESMDVKFPIAQKYDAGLVALLWGPSGLPRDADERGVLAAELMQKAMEFGIAGEDIWMDPIVTPITSPQSQVQVPSCVEFMKMFKDLHTVLIKKIIEQQRVDVDAVSGSTITSKAFLKAVENAVFAK